MKWGLYDLSKNPPGFDFLIFLQTAIPAGVDAIRFYPGFNGDHGTIEDEKRKLGKIAIPICEAFGLKWAMGADYKHKIHFPRELPRPIHSPYYLKRIEKPTPLKATQEALDKVNDVLGGRKRIVIIMRESDIEPLRNSSPDWRKWALEHDAVVLEDGQKSQITPVEYAAYMDLASVTMMSAGGPVSILFCSEHRPYLVMKMIGHHYRAIRPRWWIKNGWELGDQMPWADKSQKIVWNEVDDYQTIETEYQKYISDIQNQFTCSSDKGKNG